MGTDPWAEDSWGSEPDVSQRDPNAAVLHVPPEEDKNISQSGFIFPVDVPAWKSWENEVACPDPVFSCQQLELVVMATIAVSGFSCQGSVLVDTGCRVPLLFRKGLIPEKFLEPARRPIRITTADGTPMVGGSQGCVLTVTLPVAGLDGAPTQELSCKPYWGYEAAVMGSDLILGYPFLKIFRLVVD